MLSAEKINNPVSSTSNEQGIHHKEKAGLEVKNSFSELDTLSHCVRTPLHALGGHAADLQDFSTQFSKLKTQGSTLRINLFKYSIRMDLYLSTIKDQAELLASGKYNDFFKQTKLSSDKSNESSAVIFKDALASMTNHINSLQISQAKLKALVSQSERVEEEELKNQFDEIAKEMQVIAVQIKKEADKLNEIISPTVSAPDLNKTTSPVASPLSKNKATPRSTPLRVLIVDDMPINQKMLGNMLKDKKQYHCEFANNGKEAVEKYSENNFDIIFMDIQMPVMDGLEATQAIRQQEGRKNKKRTPIIASTAIDSSTLNTGITASAGMDGYMTKPYSKERVQEIINLHTSQDEKAGLENKNGIDNIPPLTSTLSTGKILRNFPAKRKSSVSSPELSAPSTTNSLEISPQSESTSLCPTVPVKKPAPLSISPRGTSGEHRLLTLFHWLSPKSRGHLTQGLSESDITPPLSPSRRSFL